MRDRQPASDLIVRSAPVIMLTLGWAVPTRSRRAAFARPSGARPTAGQRGSDDDLRACLEWPGFGDRVPDEDVWSSIRPPSFKLKVTVDVAESPLKRRDGRTLSVENDDEL